MILIVTQCFPPKLGGIEAYMFGLAEAFAAQGRALSVLADGAECDWDQRLGYPVTRFSGFKPLRAWRKRRAIASALRGDGVERIFFDSWKSLETAAPALRGVSPRPRLVALAHGMEFPAQPSSAKAARIKKALGLADAVLANSPYTADRARRFMDGADRLHVVTPPIPAQPEPTEEDCASLRGRLEMADGAFLIAALARHEPRKGFDHLIRGSAFLAKDHPGLVLAIAGDGPDRPRLEALAQECGAPVRFLGRISEGEKAALFKQADLFAMPSREEGDSVEGFGLVYLEAAWHGTPALAGRAGGAGAAVLDGRTGWFCDGASAASVQEALGAILADSAELKRRSEHAQAHARQQLWSARVGAFLEA